MAMSVKVAVLSPETARLAIGISFVIMGEALAALPITPVR